MPVPGPVVRASIHPAIGVARVGNAAEAFFIGPEVVDPHPEPPGFYRDSSGALKRQAARFRLYGYDADDRLVGELTAAEAEIRWTVHVANHKAAWYQWGIALDIPEAEGTVLPRRNPEVLRGDRAGLSIDPGPCTIAGVHNAAAVPLNGAFQGTAVNLGELRTDEAGRLLVLGGRGISASPSGQPIFDNETDTNPFINANGWYDDTSDGPVEATVRIGAKEIPVDPAWVITAPPNYGPGTLGVRSLYDLLLDVFTDAGWLDKPPARPSFRGDIYPILQRLSGLQWVNRGFAVQFGPQGPFNFEDPAFVARLAQGPSGADDPWRELRVQVRNAFRPPHPPDGNQLPWPWIYGDGMESPAGQSPRQNASISSGQAAVLQAWAEGNFEADWHHPPSSPRTLAAVPLAQQPAMLDRAALEWCLADAFHPGCEVTWPIRHATLFRAPFRIRQRPADQPEPELGPVLTPALAMKPNGPLYGQGPGGLTRWMGLPWQADTAFCRSGYDSRYDPYVPTFWPARVPNQVLTAEQYALVMDPSQPEQLRRNHFARRQDWTRPLPKDTSAAMLEMVRIYGSMGLLEAFPGPEDLPDLPRVIWVETVGPDYPTTGALQAAALEGGPPPGAETSGEERLGWPRPVRHPKGG